MTQPDLPLSRYELPRTSDQRFLEFHTANPEVFDALRRFALEAHRSGRKRIGMKAIFERLRWWSSVETRGDTFRLNNNYTAPYARLLVQVEPELAGFFETRGRR